MLYLKNPVNIKKNIITKNLYFEFFLKEITNTTAKKKNTYQYLFAIFNSDTDAIIIPTKKEKQSVISVLLFDTIILDIITRPQSTPIFLLHK